GSGERDTVARHFAAGEAAPLAVLLASDTDWDTPAGRRLIGRLSRGFAYLDGVAAVRSLTQPAGRPLPESPDRLGLLAGPLRWAGADVGFVNTRKAARERYLGLPAAGRPEHVTRLDVVLK